jgi:ribosomal protein S18 acetylase RimI-like enzyme
MQNRPRLSTRPAEPADEDFLFALYTSTRDDLTGIGLEPSQLAPLLEMQYRAQTSGYAAQYPNAEQSIIMMDGTRTGQMTLERRPGEIVFVDLSILSGFRGLGIGEWAIREVFREAEQFGTILSAHVSKSNRAMALYGRLGWVITGDIGSHFKLEWRP